MKQTLLHEAMKISELAYQLTNISTDDKRDLESYSNKELIEEAEYLLSTYFEGGHQNHDDLHNHYDDKEAQREARKNLRALKKLLAKHKPKG